MIKFNTLLLSSVIFISGCSIPLLSKPIVDDVPPPPFLVKERQAAAVQAEAARVIKLKTAAAVDITKKIPDRIYAPTESGSSSVIGELKLGDKLREYREKKSLASKKYLADRKALMLKLKALEESKKQSDLNLIRETKAKAKKEYDYFIKNID